MTSRNYQRTLVMRVRMRMARSRTSLSSASSEVVRKRKPVRSSISRMRTALSSRNESYDWKTKVFLERNIEKKVITTLLFPSQLQNLILLISFQIKIVCVFIFWLDGLWLVVICTVLIGGCRRMLRLRRRRNSTSCLTKNSLNQLEEERTPSPSGQSNSKSAARWR